MDDPSALTARDAANALAAAHYRWVLAATDRLLDARGVPLDCKFADRAHDSAIDQLILKSRAFDPSRGLVFATMIYNVPVWAIGYAAKRARARKNLARLVSLSVVGDNHPDPREQADPIEPFGDLLVGLKPRSRTLLDLLYRLDMTVTEAATAMGMSRMQATQVRDRAISTVAGRLCPDAISQR